MHRSFKHSRHLNISCNNKDFLDLTMALVSTVSCDPIQLNELEKLQMSNWHANKTYVRVTQELLAYQN